MNETQLLVPPPQKKNKEIFCDTGKAQDVAILLSVIVDFT